MSCANKVLPVYMWPSPGKIPEALCLPPVQVDTVHFSSEATETNGFSRLSSSLNRTAVIHTINTIHNRPQQSLETIIMTRVLALADQSKIGCITQRRFAKVGTKTHPQRGADLDRNGLSVSTETACRFEPKSPVGNSEICTRSQRTGEKSRAKPISPGRLLPRKHGRA